MVRCQINNSVAIGKEKPDGRGAAMNQRMTQIKPQELRRSEAQQSL
jgi:hypothetical protein